MKKRFLAVLLAVVMVLAMLPTAAFAAKNDLTIENSAPARYNICADALANPGDTATVENVLELLSRYDAGAYHIMKTEYDRGSNLQTWFLGVPIISSIDTTVHETYHSYTHQAGMFYGERIYLGGGKTYDVDYSIVYKDGNFTKTEEMSRNIPPELRTFRYDTYVSPGATPDANTKGVFGLLNEFTAYYWGLETMNSLTQYLLDTDTGAEGWKSYVTSVGNNMTAYAEFKYWTLRYMIYIRSANPTLYQAILNNEPYCAAYGDADAKFAAEIERSRNIVDSCQEYLRGKGCSVEWTGSGIYLLSGYSRSGVGLDGYSALMEELAKAEYAEMDSILKKNSPQQPTAPDKPAQTAYSSTQNILLNGETVELQAYALKDANGNDTNYIRLRDVAYLLNDTSARFNVGWDADNKSIAVTSKSAYSPDGSEMKTPFSGSRTYKAADSPVYLDGRQVELEAILLTDDAGNGYTYFKLRDLGKALNFNVTWDGRVVVETDKPYEG